MRALLLSAGFGTRLRPLTNDIPKCLVPIQGKPLMEYWLETFCANDVGVSHVLVNMHYLCEQVEDYVAKSPYKQYVTAVYEDRLLGTGGTLLKNRDFFRNQPVLMAHGDNLSLFDVKDFISAHRLRPDPCVMTMMTFETGTPQTCGIVELDKEGIVCAFHEKIENPPGNLANGAVYIIEPLIFDFLENLGREVIDFSTEVLPHFIGKINTFHNDRYHRDIGTMESYQAARKEIIFELI